MCPIKIRKEPFGTKRIGQANRQIDAVAGIPIAEELLVRGPHCPGRMWGQRCIDHRHFVGIGADRLEPIRMCIGNIGCPDQLGRAVGLQLREDVGLPGGTVPSARAEIDDFDVGMLLQYGDFGCQAGVADAVVVRTGLGTQCVEVALVDDAHDDRLPERHNRPVTDAPDGQRVVDDVHMHVGEPCSS